MARIPNRFVDPGNGFTYNWRVNHSEEEQFGKARNITEASPTNTVGLVKQQSEQSPLIIELKGSILHKDQHDQFVHFYALCDVQTVYFYDFAGNGYEVIITDFAPVRKRVARNPNDMVNAPLHIWEYTLKMEVLTILQGAWAGVSP